MDEEDYVEHLEEIIVSYAAYIMAIQELLPEKIKRRVK